MTRIDKNLCTGCGVCANICPEGFEMRDGLAVVKDPGAPCAARAISVCPVGAILTEGEADHSGLVAGNETAPPAGLGRGLGQGMGRGLGRGMGRGLGRGMGRGMGRGGGSGRGMGGGSGRGQGGGGW